MSLRSLVFFVCVLLDGHTYAVLGIGGAEVEE